MNAKKSCLPLWHRHILSDLPRMPGQRRKLSLCVQNIRIVSCIADLWWRLCLAGLIRKSHRLGVLADFLSFQLFPFVEVCVCLCLLHEHWISETEFCVYSCSVSKTSAANLPRHRSAPGISNLPVGFLSWERKWHLPAKRGRARSGLPKQHNAG